MKISLLTIVLISFSMSLNAQSDAETKVKETIEAFFDAFHKQDTLTLKSMARGNIMMQSISVDQTGKTVLNQNNYDQFVKSIGSIPKENQFEERLLDFSIKIDGPMANAWTPYEFWYNGSLSHCGVNSFQLIKENEEWKIIYLVDTRKREGCKP